MRQFRIPAGNLRLPLMASRLERGSRFDLRKIESLGTRPDIVAQLHRGGAGACMVEYTLRVIVEKVAVDSQEVVQRDTLTTYEIKPPASIVDLGLRHAEQIALLE